MVGLACLMQQAADLLNEVCHLAPPRYVTMPDHHSAAAVIHAKPAEPR
jgi:hypothetical protein